MLSLNDAIRCSNEIAQKDTSSDHYKNYVKLLAESLRQNQIMVDKDSRVIASTNLAAAQTFSLMKFA